MHFFTVSPSDSHFPIQSTVALLKQLWVYKMALLISIKLDENFALHSSIVRLRQQICTGDRIGSRFSAYCAFFRPFWNSKWFINFLIHSGPTQKHRMNRWLNLKWNSIQRWLLNNLALERTAEKPVVALVWELYNNFDCVIHRSHGCCYSCLTAELVFFRLLSV